MFTKIEHTEIVSSNMDRTLDFYTGILGFKLQSRRKAAADRQPLEEIAFIELGGTLVEVFGVKGPAPVSTEPWRIGCRRICLEMDDGEKTIDYLKEKGVEISQGPVITEASTMAEIKDPDGIAIQLIQRK